MKYIGFIVLNILLACHTLQAQTILEADGPGETYELINSILAPAYNVIESPDCNHEVFGRHIEEVFDSSLNKYVFLFHIHKFPDNDRCQTFDRQRNEIKSYDQSPDSLLAIRFEEVEYQWKFKLDSAFQPSASFTHLHQLKAVGGPDESIPLITLTARKKSPNQLELRYGDQLSQSTVYQADLEPMLGKWLAVKERVLFEEDNLGQYEILITDHVNGDTIFYYTNDAIRTWKTDADFIRPKWGIYRSLNDSTNLRDEQVYFADFYIKEISKINTKTKEIDKNNDVIIYPNPSSDLLMFSPIDTSKFDKIRIYNGAGEMVIEGKVENGVFSIKNLKPGVYFAQLKIEELNVKTIKFLVQR